MSSSEDRTRKALYVKLRYLADEAGLDREDRLELARYLFRDEGYPYLTSLSELKVEHLDILKWVLSGWKVVQELRLANGTLETESKIILQRLSETAAETAKRQDETGAWS